VKEIDLGIRFNFTKSVGAAATVFSGRHKNEIYYNPLTFTNTNYGKTKRRVWRLLCSGSSCLA
jgi:hypothetical protein